MMNIASRIAYFVGFSLFFLVLLSSRSSVVGQGLYGGLRGRVVDKYSQAPLTWATVLLPEKQGFETLTDSNGYFLLSSIPIGKVNVLITSVGYDSIFIPNVEINTAKQTDLNIQMEEQWHKLDEVTISTTKKSSLQSEFANVSVTSIDMKVANQFAGSLFDVARMATNFSGVIQGNDGRNDIIVRGNSPTGLIWRVNDLNVPNPNHFAGIGVTGGAVPLLNNMQIEEMAFYTSAFPAMFGNGVSGVFDLQMKKGNTEKREHYFQVGFSGFELASQGYFKKGSRSSYMISGRVSIFQVMQDIGLLTNPKTFVPRYSDLTIKLDFPIGRRNQLSAFFIGGLNKVAFLGSKFDEGSELATASASVNTSTDLTNEGTIYISGVSYKHYFSNRSFLKAIIGATGQTFNSILESVYRDNQGKAFATQDSIKQKLGRDNVQAHLYFNTKLSSLSSLRAGMILNTFFTSFSTRLYYLKYIAPVVNAGPNYSGKPAYLLQWYATWTNSFFEKKLNLNAGIYGMYLDLSQSVSYVEPRIGMSYTPVPNHRFSLGYGLHSQMQPISIYFFQDSVPGSPVKVTPYDFTYSHQAVASYTWKFWKTHSLTLEGYYQHLFNVPVSQKTNFSVLNAGADFTIPVEFNLANKGTGDNMGIELTWKSDRYHGFYHLLTMSLFSSTYQTFGQKTFPTVFDNGYVTNALVGKEWEFLNDKLILGGSTRVVYAGGLRYTDLLKEASLRQGNAVYDDAHTYAKKMPDYLRLDVRVQVRHNISKRFSQEWIVELTNILNRQNAWLPNYNARNNTLDILKQGGFLWVIFYRFYF